MLRVFEVETKQIKSGSQKIERGNEIEANRKVWNTSKNNSRKIYDRMKNVSIEDILLCINVSQVFDEPEPTFGIASLDIKNEEINWSEYTTIALLRYFSQTNTSDEKIFKNALRGYIQKYLHQQLAEIPVLVSDQHNLQRCLSVLDEMSLEYKVMS